MRKLDKPSPTESPLLFEIESEPAPETLTALGGMPLVVQTFRSLGLPASVPRYLPLVLQPRKSDPGPGSPPAQRRALAQPPAP